MRDIATTPVGVYQSYFSGRVRADGNQHDAERALEGDRVTIGDVPVYILDGVSLEEARAITGETTNSAFDEHAAQGACLTEECSDDEGSIERTTISVDEARNMLGYMQRYAEAHNLSEATVRALYRNGASFERVNLSQVRDSRAVRGDELVQRYAAWRETNPNGTFLDWASTAQNAYGLGIPATNSPLYSNLQAYIEAAPEEEPRSIEDVANFLLLSAYSSRHPDAGQRLVMSDLVGNSFQPVTNFYGRNYENEPDLLTWLRGENVDAAVPEEPGEVAETTEEAPTLTDEGRTSRTNTWLRFLRLYGYTGDALPNVTGIPLIGEDDFVVTGLSQEQFTALVSYSANNLPTEIPACENEEPITYETVEGLTADAVRERLETEGVTLEQLEALLPSTVPGSDLRGEVYSAMLRAQIAGLGETAYSGTGSALVTLAQDHPNVRFALGDELTFYAPNANDPLVFLGPGGETLSFAEGTDQTDIIRAGLAEEYGADAADGPNYYRPYRAVSYLAGAGHWPAGATEGTTINLTTLVGVVTPETARPARSPARDQALSSAMNSAVVVPEPETPVVEESEVVAAEEQGEAEGVAEEEGSTPALVRQLQDPWSDGRAAEPVDRPVSGVVDPWAVVTSPSPLATRWAACSGSLLAFLTSSGARVTIGRNTVWVEDEALHISDGRSERSLLNTDRVGQGNLLQLIIDEEPSFSGISNPSFLTAVVEFLERQSDVDLNGRTIDLPALYTEADDTDLLTEDNGRVNLDNNGMKQLLSRPQEERDSTSPPPAEPPASKALSSAANYREVRITV